MQEIEFETDKYKNILTTRNTRWLTRLVMKVSGGYIKDEEQASYVALAFALTVIVGVLYTTFSVPEEAFPPSQSVLEAAFDTTPEAPPAGSQ